MSAGKLQQHAIHNEKKNNVLFSLVSLVVFSHACYSVSSERQVCAVVLFSSRAPEYAG